LTTASSKVVVDRLAEDDRPVVDGAD